MKKQIHIGRKMESLISVQKFLFLLTGIYGILLVIRSASSISFSAGLVFPVITLFCTGMYVLFHIRRKWFWPGTAGMFLIFTISAVLQWDLFTEQILALTGSLTGTVQGERNVTFPVLFIMFILSGLFFVLEIIREKHWLPYIVTTMIMAGAPLFGIHVSIGSVLLCLIFQILFWTIHTAGREKRFFSAADANRRRMPFPVRCTAFMGAVLSGLICVSVLITSVWGTELSDAVTGGEGFLSRSFQRITGRARQSAADGHVSSGNNYRTGDVQLEVTVLEQPTETLYLKGFSGGEYTGGDWEPADDQAVFEAMAQTLNWESWESWISGMYYSLYFSMNELMLWNETAGDGTEQNETIRYGETDGARIVYLNHVREGYDRIFAPYYGRWLNLRESAGRGYAFGYFEESQMNIDWENIPRLLREPEAGIMRFRTRICRRFLSFILMFRRKSFPG